MKKAAESVMAAAMQNANATVNNLHFTFNN